MHSDNNDAQLCALESSIRDEDSCSRVTCRCVASTAGEGQYSTDQRSCTATVLTVGVYVTVLASYC